MKVAGFVIAVLVSVVNLSCTSASSSPASDPADPADPANDRARLLELHAESMEAHRAGDVERLLADEGQEFVVASRGEISHPTVEERRAFLGPYLRATRFTEYVDVVPPIVKVSRDGTLGWVIVQVRAKGEQVVADGSRQPLEFESAWISLYEKHGGEWRRIGNVSNFKQ